MACRLHRRLARFRADERAAASLEFVMIFTPLMFLIFLIVQVAIAYHWSLSTQKGLEMAARVASVTPPVDSSLVVQTGLGMRVVNREINLGFEYGDRCIDGACAAIADSICTGAAFTPDDDGNLPVSNCDYTRFKAIFDEVDRFAYSLEIDDLAIAYEDVRLGYAGQKYVPLIVLAVNPQSMPIILRMFTDETEFQIPEILATIVAEDLSN